MTPILIPLRNFGKENHRVLPAIPQTPLVSTATTARMVLAHFDREVKIWKMDDLDHPNEIDDDDLFGMDAGMRGRRLVGRVMLNVRL